MAFIRAREIEGELRNRGQEKGTLYVLQVLAEQQIALQKDMRDCADLINGMMDILNGVTAVGERMKETIAKLGQEPKEDDLDRNTHAL
jgi:hypothetical protein